LWNNHLPDVMIVGMGPDGHIASLFPPLAENLMDDTRLVAHTTTDTFAVHDRITLTLNPITAAEHHVFLLKGEDKKQLWEEMMDSAENEQRWPAKRIVDHSHVTVVFG
jgi:6-phosphogluconolactonase/glucosamine-6-phosphate isomerase/deaminase